MIKHPDFVIALGANSIFKDNFYLLDGIWMRFAIPVSVIRAASTSIFTNMNVTGIKADFLEGQACSTNKPGTLFPLG